MDGHILANKEKLALVSIFIEILNKCVTVNKLGVASDPERQFRDSHSEVVVSFSRFLTEKETLAVHVLFHQLFEYQTNFNLIILNRIPRTYLDDYARRLVRQGVEWIYHTNMWHPNDLYKQWGTQSLLHMWIIDNCFPKLKDAEVLKGRTGRDYNGQLLGLFNEVLYNQPYFQKQISLSNSFRIGFIY